MKEAFLAALLSIGPGADNEIQLMGIVTPVKASAGEVISVRNFVPAMTGADNKIDVTPQVVRHVNALKS